MKTVLICHHDPSYLSLMSDYLREHGYSTLVTMDARQVVGMLLSERVQLCLVDALLPDGAGIDLLHQLVRLYPHLPVVWLSPIQSREEQLMAYRNGCSDYVTLPADMEMLMARMDALMRLVAPDDEQTMPTSFRLGALDFDGIRHRLGNQVLSARESDLLLLLCRYQGQVVLRSYILTSLWGTDDVFAARSLAVFINRLRKYLNSQPHVAILSVRGKGYKLTINTV